MHEALYAGNRLLDVGEIFNLQLDGLVGADLHTAPTASARFCDMGAALFDFQRACKTDIVLALSTTFARFEDFDPNSGHSFDSLSDRFCNMG